MNPIATICGVGVLGFGVLFGLFWMAAIAYGYYTVDNEVKRK